MGKLIIMFVGLILTLVVLYFIGKLAIRLYHFARSKADSEYQTKRQATRDFNASREDLEDAINRFETTKGK